MKYIMWAIQVMVTSIGIYMMFKFPNVGNPPFVSGLALALIGVYLYISSCSCMKCKCWGKKKK